MNNNRYKVILSNKIIYKEIDLTSDMSVITLGTSTDCDIRLRKEFFFEAINITFQNHENAWEIICSDNLYFDTGDFRRFANLELSHGMEFKVRYRESNNEILKFSFVIDFDYERKDYSRKIDISNQNQIKIGGRFDANILLNDEYLGSDYVVLKRQGNKIVLCDHGTRYGVYVNGIRIKKDKEIRECDFFSIAGYSFYYRNSFLFTSSKQYVQLNGLTEIILEKQSTCYEYPKFVRNTRIQHEIPEEEIEIQQPIAKPSLKKRSLVLTLIPAIVMLAMTIVLRGIMGGGGTFVIYSAVSMSMGIIMSIVTYIQEKKQFKENVRKREESYKKYIEEKEAAIVQSRERELDIRRMIFESLENSLKEVEHFGRRMFEKTPEDKDYLQIYLGAGTIESVNQVGFNKQEFVDPEDPISILPEQISEKYRYIDNAPIISDFKSSNGIGITGNKSDLQQLLRNMTLDLAIRHFYKEVRMVYILEPEYIEQFKWLRWLHNVENEQLDVRNIVCDEESKNVLLENLYAILSAREAIINASKDYSFEEQYVVFVTSASAISSHPISKYIKNCTVYGFTFVFLEVFEENIPQGCTEIIRLDSVQKGKILKTENGDGYLEFTYPMISEKTAEKMALRLGATYVDEVTLESQLTKNITMFEMLGIISTEDLDLEKRWGSSQVYRTIAAPIGVKANNEIVCLNISDKSNGHGPHGLVAGTTGSGKSEILQTYILSIATLFHPYDVGFVLIDFKGGGMAKQFSNLPHLIGTITNIDGREINRSLLSIKAELVKRQELFAEAQVNHINDYIKLYKSGKVSNPLPHLIMIVDEFAELKAEYPDFMKELISAARIGRTLGVHLILATQKPAGVVDAQIWSNSKFKLCLKVQTKEDSNEVLKTPLAAEIVEPGRAYFQVGNNEIFELIQSAYSGANVPEGNESNENIFAIYERNIWGKKTMVYTNKKKKEADKEISQLQAIVDYVGEYCLTNKIEQLPGICLPSLKTVIKTEELDYNMQGEFGISIPVGYYDDPEQQKQGIVEFELSKENIYIVGSAQMGKTVLLQTIAYGIIKKYTPQQVNLYVVDCGSMVLKILEDSVHVGGVVLSNEDEKCKNLFKLLGKTITERKRVLSGKGVGNYASYLEAGYTDMPLIVVMIDNMAAFKEYFPEQDALIGSYTREAQGVGISFVVTAAASNAMNYRVQANFANKLVLNCNDTAEYSNVFGHCKETPRENAGRGFIQIERRVLEWQAAVFGKSNKEAERSEELKKYIKDRNKECTGCAYRIPMVPEKLILADEMKKDVIRFRTEGILPIGMDYATVDYSEIDLNQSGSLTLLGNQEARIRFTLNFMEALAKNVVFHNVEAIVIDDKQRSLETVKKYGFVKSYTLDTAEGMERLSDFYEAVEEREDSERPSDFTTILLVVNNVELFRNICGDKIASKEFANALKRSNTLKSFVLLTMVDNQPVGFNASEVLKTIRDEKSGLLFAPINENKFYEVSGRVKADTVFEKTMAYRFDQGSYAKIKIFE